MHSIIDKTYQFLFHPLHQEHTQIQSALSMIVVIGLTALSGGIFGIIFAVVQWKDRKITISSQTPPTQLTNQVFDKTITQPHSKAKKTTHLVKNKPSESSKIKLIKEKHAEQIKKFEEWTQTAQWEKIKQAHYDWWMFPVNRDSASYGSTYTVNEQDINTLKQDLEFMKAYKRGFMLVVQAWGWDLEQEKAIQNSGKHQYWDGYGVRLAKMSDSLKLFDEIDLHKKLKIFFMNHCLPLQQKIEISNLVWLKQTFNIP